MCLAAISQHNAKNSWYTPHYTQTFISHFVYDVRQGGNSLASRRPNDEERSTNFSRSARWKTIRRNKQRKTAPTSPARTNVTHSMLYMFYAVYVLYFPTATDAIEPWCGDQCCETSGLFLRSQSTLVVNQYLVLEYSRTVFFKFFFLMLFASGLWLCNQSTFLCSRS